MLIQLCAGSALGLISSAPIGPINLTIIGAALKSGLRRSAAIAITVAIVDGIYAFMAVSALSMPRWSTHLSKSVGLLGALLIICYGIFLLLSKGTTSRKSAASIKAPLFCRDLSIGVLTGIAMYVTNPTFILFWLSAVGAVRLWVPTAVVGNHYIFGIGVILGTAAWFFFLLCMVRRSSALQSPKLRKRLSMVAGCLLIAFGCYALITT